MVKTALALGAGGARGFAHLGVLEVIKEKGIKIDMIVGASIGSFIGAFYAYNPDIDWLKSEFFALKSQDVLGAHPFNPLRFFMDYPVEKLIRSKMKARNIEELGLEFYALALDINSGEKVIFDKGDIAKAVHASCALPPLLTPVKYQGRVLIDGGIAEPVPVETARKMGADRVIAVDISTVMPENSIKNPVDWIIKSACISYYWLAKEQCAKADVVITPNVDKYSILDDRHKEAMYEEGKKAAYLVL